ncbi:MAG: hypothetical protein ACI9BF_000377 [Candidatus Paceibacteria bacterium]|jgi:hypothetical protein
MIPNSLFSQLTMILVSSAIVFTYVRPSLNEIASVQDTVIVYKEKRESVVVVNKQLTSLVTRLESVSNIDKNKLLTYLPDAIDYVSVHRDLLLISREAGVTYLNSVYLDENSNSNSKKEYAQEDDINLLAEHKFTLSIEGTYGQLKNLLYLIEKNHYPLEVRKIDVQPKEGDVLSTEITLATYTYQSQTYSDQLTF